MGVWLIFAPLLAVMFLQATAIQRQNNELRRLNRVLLLMSRRVGSIEVQIATYIEEEVTRRVVEAADAALVPDTMRTVLDEAA